jgi:hypothetical protein
VRSWPNAHCVLTQKRHIAANRRGFTFLMLRAAMSMPSVFFFKNAWVFSAQKVLTAWSSTRVTLTATVVPSAFVATKSNIFPSNQYSTSISSCTHCAPNFSARRSIDKASLYSLLPPAFSTLGCIERKASTLDSP